MKIEVREDYRIQLEEVYNPITIKTRDGVEFHICQRDYGIEVSCNGNTKYLDESLGEKKEGDFLSTYNGWVSPKIAFAEYYKPFNTKEK
jgi:hypothetical protein